MRVSCGTCKMRKIRGKFQRSLLIGYFIADFTKTDKARRVSKGIPGIRDLTKIQCGIRENVDGIRDLTATPG